MLYQIAGTVFEGKGEASAFTALDWLQAFCRAQFGFTPYPGTLNLRVENARRRLDEVLAQAVRIEPGEAGYCAALAVEVVLNEVVKAVWIIPEVPGYPADQVELMAGVSLRRALGLANGDSVIMRVVEQV
jgi:riboflavin kinase, archaea type